VFPRDIAQEYEYKVMMMMMMIIIIIIIIIFIIIIINIIIIIIIIINIHSGTHVAYTPELKFLLVFTFLFITNTVKS